MRLPSIAFVPIARTTFDVEFAHQKSQAALQHLQAGPFQVIGSDSLISDVAALEQCIADLQHQPVDLVVIFQATFADSSMVMELAQALDAPLFLWAVPEAHSGGRLRLNSLCGINLAGHALTRAGFYYKHFYAAPEADSVVNEIVVLARASRARRILKTARLGRVGENPDGFETCQVDPAKLAQRFGLEIVQLDLQTDIFEKVRALTPASTQPIADQLAQRVKGLDDMQADAVHGTLGTYQTLKDFASHATLQGFAVRCWPEFFTELGCAACGAMSMLSDELIPCSCEADVNGTITQLILQSISAEQAFGTDMVSIDEDQDAMVLWHCGLAPLSMADPQAEKRVTIHSNRQLPLLMEFPLKPGKVTIARLSEASGDYVLAIGTGEIIRAPQSFSGTSGLLKFDKPSKDVLDIILGTGLEHHLSLTYGEYIDELIAFAKMLNLPVIPLT